MLSEILSELCCLKCLVCIAVQEPQERGMLLSCDYRHLWLCSRFGVMLYQSLLFGGDLSKLMTAVSRRLTFFKASVDKKTHVLFLKILSVDMLFSQ